MRALLEAVAVASSALLALGCSGFDGGEDVLAPPLEPGAETDVETAIAASAGAADWSCLSARVGTTTVSPNLERSYTISMQIVDQTTSLPPPGLRVRACNNFDPNCTTPRTPDVTPGEDGLVRLELFEGFTGFFEVQSDTTVSTMFFLPGPVQGDWQVPTLFLPTPASLEVLSQLNAVDHDPMRSTLGGIALDCSGVRASGVTFSEDSQEGFAFYFVNQRPTGARMATAADGSGGFANAPAGRQLLMRGIVAATGQEVANVAVSTRASWVSSTVITPALPVDVP